MLLRSYMEITLRNEYTIKSPPLNEERPPMRNATGIYLLGALFLSALTACNESAIEPDPAPPDPHVVIELPPPTLNVPFYSQYTIFRWREAEEAAITHVRHLFTQVVDTTGEYNPGFDLLGDLSANAWRYEEQWSQWISIGAPDGAGRMTIIGDDETVTLGRYHIFAVQAMDAEEQVTEVFSTQVNARKFGVTNPTGPTLRLYDPILRGGKFIGTISLPVKRRLPPGVPVTIRWAADASSYGGEIVGYRYGWDVPDFETWDAPYLPSCTSSLEAAFNVGTHTIYIEAIDQMGKVTRGGFEITIVPWPMDRNLLWVDDFPSADFTQIYWAIPTETQHDLFWTEICSRAVGFAPTVDVYDTQQHGLRPPPIEQIGSYKNIIWTYSAYECAWQTLVYFTPESEIGQDSRLAVDYLPIFLTKGGHLWTLGRSDRNGGLAAILASQAQVFPMSIECEITGNTSGCGDDRSGVLSFPYRDYCVTMLDKVQGTFRDDGGMPFRYTAHYDVMTHAYRDETDQYTVSHPGLPSRLELWEEITQPGRFFDPDSLGLVGGFTYVEVYDPRYWMLRKGEVPQHCFHPIYRMKAKSENSVLNDCTIALWVTQHENIVPSVASGLAVAAPSFHFGFPLWFFERSAVDSIVQVVFEEWGIEKQ
jgi:hypothetical protein